MICLSPSDVVRIGTEIAIALSKNRTPDEISVLRNLAAQIAATLLTISAQDKIIKDCFEKKD